MPRKEEKMKCKICDEKIEKEDLEYTWYTFSGKQVHDSCYNEQIEYASRVEKFGPGGNESTLFNEDFNFSEPGESLPEPIKKIEWISTDAWRGYTDWKLQDGFEAVADGWVTGVPDETTSRKARLGDLFEDLKEGKIVPPIDIFWVFGITSNIFSQSSSVVVRKKDKKKLAKWLEEIGTNVGKLSDDFN